MKWQTKALIYGVLSVMPAGNQIRTLGQKLFGGLRTWRVAATLQYAKDLLAAGSETGFDIQGKDTLEIGTGWVPVLPVLFWVLGYTSCHTYDLNRLLQSQLTSKTLTDMCCKLEKEHGLTLDASRLKSLRAILVHADLNKIFDLCQIFYHAPADATQTGLPTQSVDLVYSNNTLEHISKPVLEGLFQEAHRLLRRKGVMMHHIDLTDHYSHQDASITSINFLHFTETEFRKYNNRFIYQNRLRPNHYRELIERAGFRVVAWSVDVNERAMQPFSKKLLAAPYDQLSREEICAARVRVVAERL